MNALLLSSKKSISRVFLALVAFTLLTLFSFNSLYINSQSQQRIERITKSVSNTSGFPDSCWPSSYAFDNPVAVRYVAESVKNLRKKYGNCYNIPSEPTFEIKELANDSFIVTLNTAFIAEQQSQLLSEVDGNELECSIKKTDKTQNKNDLFHSSEWTSNMKFELVASDRVALRAIRPMEFKLQSHGFYRIQCFIYPPVNDSKYIFEDIISIFPADMTRLVKNNRPNREKIEALRAQFVKANDSAVNPMLDDLAYEECDRVEPAIDQLSPKMNVMIMAIDSISLPNLKRAFPLTYKYVNEELENNLMFENVNLVGRNTYPFTLALMCGLIHEPNDEHGTQDEVNYYRGDLKQGPTYDMFPFIWNRYEKELGYLTALNQDKSVFHYKGRGFKYQPTSVFMSPYWLNYFEVQGQDRNTYFCHNRAPMYKRYLDQNREFVRRMFEMNETVPFFSFSMSFHETHDQLTVSEGNDAYLKETIEMFEKKGYLENTLFMFMSDHGARMARKLILLLLEYVVMLTGFVSTGFDSFLLFFAIFVVKDYILQDFFYVFQLNGLKRTKK
jgi:hypothetical protein